MLPDNTPAPSDVPKPISSSGTSAVRKQPTLKRSSGSATNASKPAGIRKNSGAEYGNPKSQAAVTFRRSLSQTELTRELERGLQRPSKPLQVPLQLPLQLPAGKVQLTAVGMRKWLKIEASGSTSILQVNTPAHPQRLTACICYLGIVVIKSWLCLQADKQSITHELGIQVRDLRLLDPAMATSYPSAILCRDKALLVNMEHIKCIITTGYLLLLNADQPSVLQFAEDVKFRLAHSTHAHAPKEAVPLDTKTKKKASLMKCSNPDSDLDTYLLINHSGSSETSSVSHKSFEDSPFELKALEAVLDTVCIASFMPCCFQYCSASKRQVLQCQLSSFAAGLCKAVCNDR